MKLEHRNRRHELSMAGDNIWLVPKDWVAPSSVSLEVVRNNDFITPKLRRLRLRVPPGFLFCFLNRTAIAYYYNLVRKVTIILQIPGGWND